MNKTNDNQTTPATAETTHKFYHRVMAVLLKAVLPAAILVLAGLGAKRMIDTAPKAPRRPNERQAKLVEVIRVQPHARAVHLEAMGTVIPSRQVELRPQVSGRIEWVSPHLVPGGHFNAGDTLLQIEKSDFQLALAQRQSDVQMAQANVIQARRTLTLAQKDFSLEQGSQSVARREYELLEDQITDDNRELVLRQPQLLAAQAQVDAAKAGVQSAQAALDAAKSRLENAKLNLARTTITVPFPVSVEDKYVDTGDTVSPSTPLVALIGNQEYWVELALPENELPWVSVPATSDNTGSLVRIRNDRAWPEGLSRLGHVIRRLPSVDARGRMVRLLVSVPDPLSLKPENQGQPALLVGSYVTGEIQGTSFDAIYALPRPLLREGDSVWIMNDDGKLDVRPVNIAYRGRDEILIRSGLEPGDRVVVTDLSVPVEGMALRLPDVDSPADTATAQGTSQPSGEIQ